jgi:hypothetical protein
MHSLRACKFATYRCQGDWPYKSREVIPLLTLRLFGLMVAIASLPGTSAAQNWLLTIQDRSQGTAINQVNGLQGGTATVYGSIDNLTGTSISDDGTGNPVPTTLLDFAGFGFVLGPGQTDLGSRYLADPRAPGFPQVNGSPNGIDPGSIPFTSLGAFDLTGLLPGIYQEDIVASAYPDDINSNVPFGDITGTLTLNVVAQSNTPEPSGSFVVTISIVLSALLMARSKRKRARVS